MSVSMWDFYNENQSQIFIGGVTIICLSGLYKIFSNSTTKKVATIKEEDKLKVINGDVLNYTLAHVKPGYDVTTTQHFFFHTWKSWHIETKNFVNNAIIRWQGYKQKWFAKQKCIFNTGWLDVQICGTE